MLYKREGSPFWWFKVPEYNRAGQVSGYVRQSTKKTKKAEAKLVMDQYVSKVVERRGVHGLPDPTMRELFDEYVQSLRSKGKQDITNTVIICDQLIGHARPLSSGKNLYPKVDKKKLLDADMRVSQLERSMVQDLMSAFLDAGYSPSSWKNRLIVLRAAVNYARERGYDVDTRLNFNKLTVPSKTKQRFLTVSEERELLERLDPYRDIKGQPEFDKRSIKVKRGLHDQYDLVVLLLDTGARFSEIVSMAWHQIDMVDGTCLLHRHKTNNETVVPLTDRALEVLKNRQELHHQWNLRSPFVFPSDADMSKPRGYAVRGIERAIEEAGLNPEHIVSRHGRLTVHSFRHTFATRLLNQGFSLWEVSKLLGHADTTMVEKHYGHLVRGSLIEKTRRALQGTKQDTVQHLRYAV